MTIHFQSADAAHFLARHQAASHLNAHIHMAVEVASIAVTSPDAPPDAPPGAHQAMHGWRLGVKDSIDVAGMPTTAGSRVHQGHVPKPSAIARLQQAGAIVLGKTNLHGFCFGNTSYSGVFGP